MFAKIARILGAIALIGACTDDGAPVPEVGRLFTCPTGRLGCGIIGDPCTVWPAITEVSGCRAEPVCERDVVCVLDGCPWVAPELEVCDAR